MILFSFLQSSVKCYSTYILPFCPYYLYLFYLSVYSIHSISFYSYSLYYFHINLSLKVIIWYPTGSMQGLEMSTSEWRLSDLLEDVCHHSRPIPVPCLLPQGQAHADQPVKAQRSRGAVPEPGHQGAVVHLLQVCVCLLSRSWRLGSGGGWRSGMGGSGRALQRSLQRGHQALGCSGCPRLGV